jgi:hypothetical protein
LNALFLRPLEIQAMNQITKQHFVDLYSKDANLRYDSFQYIIKLTQQPVDWTYEVWDDLLDLLKTGDNHQRAIAHRY